MFFGRDDKKEAKSAALPLLPLRDIVVFPHMVSKMELNSNSRT